VLGLDVSAEGGGISAEYGRYKVGLLIGWGRPPKLVERFGGYRMKEKPQGGPPQVGRAPPVEHAPLKVWAGRGSGLPCAHCEQPIGINEVEYELSVAAVSARLQADRGVLRLHLKGHNPWRAAKKD
jgi:hypothetical protein